MKIHLIRSDFPLVAGVEQTADCGMVIKNAVFPFILDMEFKDATTLNSLRVCSKCLKCHDVAVYLYGLLNGAERPEMQL